MRERTDLVGEVDELCAQSAYSALELPVAVVRKRGEFVQRLSEQRNALDDVVVQLAGDARTLLFLRREQFAAERACRRQIASLLDDDRRHDRCGQNSCCQGASDEDPPELG